MSGAPPPALETPTAEQLLESVLELGRDVHLETSEDEILERFLRTLAELFPGRAVVIRSFELRTGEVARVQAVGGKLREGLATDRITVKRSAVEKTRLKTAVTESARLRVDDRWDSPFQGLASGFSVPLVASGELYGALDVGYPLGTDLSSADEPLVLPIANQLAVVLRNERLHRETMVLRDYQAKLIEHANALILGVDRHWRINVCNHALCELIGAPREEILGSDLRDWLPADDKQRLSMLILDSLSGRVTDTIDIELLTGAGGSVRTLWSVAAISRGGKVEAVVAVGQDQTKLRELQSQVIQAEKLATLGQLAAGVVHELNNPLTSITVYADFLIKKVERSAPMEGQDVEKLRRISAGAQRILSFAKDLVQYAKPAGVDAQPVALNSIVEQSLSFCEHLFNRAGVRLVKQIDLELQSLEAVPGQIEQVVINLVTNAVHAAPEGGTVWVRTFADGDERVGIVIEDDGDGVADPDRERIFEPFFTTKYGGTGTGLGLSIVKNIIEQHQGEITVGEAESGGASFRVVLPRTGAR